MSHCFRIMVQGKIETYSKFEDIPEVIDHVIEFSPEVPPPPHTEPQHREIDAWQHRLQELMRREHASGS